MKIYSGMKRHERQVCKQDTGGKHVMSDNIQSDDQDILGIIFLRIAIIGIISLFILFVTLNISPTEFFHYWSCDLVERYYESDQPVNGISYSEMEGEQLKEFNTKMDACDID